MHNFERGGMNPLRWPAEGGDPDADGSVETDASLGSDEDERLGGLPAHESDADVAGDVGGDLMTSGGTATTGLDESGDQSVAWGDTGTDEDDSSGLPPGGGTQGLPGGSR